MDKDINLVLVDNEEVTRTTWEIKSEELGLKIKLFSSAEELLVNADQVSKDVPLFLDSDLGNHKKGESYAQILKEIGFTKIYLTTAYHNLHGQKLPYVDLVIDKSFSKAMDVLKTNNSSDFEVASAPAVS